MNDVSNRAVREFSEFLNSIEADFPKPTCTTAYEITMKSTIVSALITLDTEKQMDERFGNHLRVQRNILDFLYTLWLDDDRTLVDEFSTIIRDLVEYDFSIVEEQMKERKKMLCDLMDNNLYVPQSRSSAASDVYKRQLRTSGRMGKSRLTIWRRLTTT